MYLVQKLEEKEEEAISYLISRGMALILASLMILAIRHFEEALDLKPNTMEVIQNLALSLGKKSHVTTDSAERERLFWRAIANYQKVTPKDAFVLVSNPCYRLLTVLVRLGQHSIPSRT